MKIKYKILTIILFPVISIANSISFQMENDSMFHSDNDYSNGIRINYNYNNLDTFIGQHIYTPSSIRNMEKDDRPYAGWSYFGLGYTDIGIKYNNLRYVGYYETLIGVVGKASGSEWVQKKVHKIIGAGYPTGWESQIEDEFGFQLNTKQGFEYTMCTKKEYSAIVCPDLVVICGSTQDSIGFDTSFKFGYNIPISKTDSEFMVRSIKKDFSIYGILGTEFKYWKNNLFLDGNEDSKYKVNKKDYTCVVKTGICSSYKHIGIDFLILWGTKEYDTQKDMPNYASIKITYIF